MDPEICDIQNCKGFTEVLSKFHFVRIVGITLSSSKKVTHLVIFITIWNNNLTFTVRYLKIITDVQGSIDQDDLIIP